MTYQIPLPLNNSCETDLDDSVRDCLMGLLCEDLNFHDGDSGYASHGFHSFPAKFPPQLPRKFIESLTNPGDLVLDPMMGSGTTPLEASLLGRRTVGFDIDPMAVMITNVKSCALDASQLSQIGYDIVKRAELFAKDHSDDLSQRLKNRGDARTRQFIDYWFLPQTQVELLALIDEIEKLPDASTRRFFEVAFSSTIITKSGGVSLALDLAHTRPHKAKVIKNEAGKILQGAEFLNSSSRRMDFITKIVRSPIVEFGKRIRLNLNGLRRPFPILYPPLCLFGNAERLPLPENSVDLIVTSPPYAANAIDYMRAHKFSLVWLGYSIDELGDRRGTYIGGESLRDVNFTPLPVETAKVVRRIIGLDESKGQALHRYYSEMTRVLRQMFRVLKPGKAAIVVVGNSMMRGESTETHHCLAEIGVQIGFEVPLIGVRALDRNRRMLPAGSRVDLESQIQQRMHEEYVIGFYKPLS